LETYMNPNSKGFRVIVLLIIDKAISSNSKESLHLKYKNVLDWCLKIILFQIQLNISEEIP
jgi:hypothetical protein